MVNHGTANEKNFFLVGTLHKRFIDGMGGLAAYELFVVRAQHDVPAVWQGSFWQRKKRVPPHDHSVTGGDVLEVFQIAWQVAKEFVVLTDGVVVGDGDNDGCFHKFLNGNRSFDVRMWIVVFQRKVFEGETEYIVDFWIYF